MRPDELPVHATHRDAELRGRLLTAIGNDPERQREGNDKLYGVENNLKRHIGRTRALNDPSFLAKIAANEQVCLLSADQLPELIRELQALYDDRKTWEEAAVE